MGNASLGIRGRGLAALTVALALTSPASAAFINFDPDGAAPGNPAQTVAGLDWAVGNSLAEDLAAPDSGQTFQLYYQATLAGVINTQGLTVAPAGLNSQFEITAVMSATAIVTSVVGTGPGATSVTYRLAVTRTTNNFFEMWYDSTPDANNLAGTGFNDGQRIFLGSPDQTKTSIGSYTNAPGAQGPALELFDQFGADNYAGKQSLVIAGGFSDENSVSSQDPAFFITPLASMSFNTSTVDPFKQVDPSQLFAALAGGAAPALVPNLGTVNGQSDGFGINDIQFQSDANVSFVEVPEPGTALAAMGFPFVTLMASRRR